MNPKPFFILLFLANLMAGNLLFAQAQPAYKLPDSYHFDYEVTQALISHKNATDTCILHFFYTKSGDYAAARISKHTGKNEKLLVVLTRDGNSIIFDEQKGNIIVISLRKLISDLSGLAKWIRMDSVFAHLREGTNDKHIQSVKTNNTKQVSGYTAEEYSLTGGKGHKASVWCAKVDFNTQVDYILGSGIGNLLEMMKGQLTGHALFLALTQPRTLVTEFEGRDSQDGTEMSMHTESISQVPTTVATSGYQVKNYSNMTLPEIFQAEMNKKNN